jgi:hypothetical protein
MIVVRIAFEPMALEFWTRLAEQASTGAHSEIRRATLRTLAPFAADRLALATAQVSRIRRPSANMVRTTVVRSTALDRTPHLFDDIKLISV